MNDGKYLAGRFREVMLNGRWIANTNFKDQLDTLSLVHASSKHKGFNTPLALCFHIFYYIKGLNDCFESGKLEIKDKFSFDHPRFETEEEWRKFKANVWSESEKFARYVENMDDNQLETIFIDEKYGTYKRNIDGMIEHAYYHLGQLVLIKKMIGID